MRPVNGSFRVLKRIALTGASSPRSSSTGSPPMSLAGIAVASTGEGSSRTTESSRAELPMPWPPDDIVTGNRARDRIPAFSPWINCSWLRSPFSK